MAITNSSTKCAICGLPIDHNGDNYATTAFLASDHQLWKFNDAAIHWNCFFSWDKRREFAQAYAESKIADELQQPFWHLILDSRHVLVTFGERVGQLRILLKLVPISFLVPLHELDDWAEHPSLPEDLSRHRLIVEAFNESIADLTSIKGKAKVLEHLADNTEVIKAKKEAAVQRLGLKLPG